MEEKQMMTNQELESQLQSMRVKAAIITWFFMEKIVMGLVFLVVAFVFASLSSNCSDKLKKFLSDNIIGGVRIHLKVM